MHLLFVVWFVVLSGVAQAQVPDQGAWESLLARIIDQGKVTETFAGVYVTLSNQEQSHQLFQTDYISTVGSYDTQGRYLTSHIELVSEDWRTDSDGNWDIDQWLIAAETDGSIRKASHIHLVEDPTGSILKYERFPVETAESLKIWNTELKAWEHRK